MPVSFEASMKLGIIDWLFLILICFCIIKCTIRGFILEFFSKAAVICGGIVAVLFYKLLSRRIAEFTEDITFLPVISFLILFLATYLIVKIIELLLGSLFANGSLRNLDRALGFFLGIFEGFLFIIAVIILFNNLPIMKTFFSDSIFVNFLLPLL